MANCTFLATEQGPLIQAAGLLRLHARGYVEPLRPVRSGAHLLARQLMALSLQENGVPASDWWAWLSAATPFQGLTDGDRDELLEHMLRAEILHKDGGRLSLGKQGEKLYGFRNFTELYAVFATADTMNVVHAGAEIGRVETRFVEAAGDKPLLFTLGGRPWIVTHTEWSKGIVHVRPAERSGHAQWRGHPGFLGRELCGAMREVLTSTSEDAWWSKRAREHIKAAREEHAFLEPSGPQLHQTADRLRLWTFAGGAANALLARLAEAKLGGDVASNNTYLTFGGESARSDQAITEWIGELRSEGRPTREDAIACAGSLAHSRISKFEPCLPLRLEAAYLADVLTDPESARLALRGG